MSMLSDMLFYNRFIKRFKGRITDVPSLDAVTNYFLENRKKVDMKDWQESYRLMVDYFKDENFEYPCGDIYEKLPRKGIIKTDYSNKHFVNYYNVNNTTKRHASQDEECKLWINTSLENVGELALALAEFIDDNDKKLSCTHQHSNTNFKTTYTTRRNDTITIYTNYKEAERIIDFLVKLKEERPQLFQTDRFENPLVMKIDGFISYADVPHEISFPKLIAEMFAWVETHFEVDKVQQNRQFDYAKALFIEGMLRSLRRGYCINENLINLNNLGITHLGLKRTNKLSIHETETTVKKLKKVQSGLIEGLELNDDLKL